jgi:hypothetical protein
MEAAYSENVEQVKPFFMRSKFVFDQVNSLSNHLDSNGLIDFDQKVKELRRLVDEEIKSVSNSELRLIFTDICDRHFRSMKSPSSVNIAKLKLRAWEGNMLNIFYAQVDAPH